MTDIWVAHAESSRDVEPQTTPLKTQVRKPLLNKSPVHRQASILGIQSTRNGLEWSTRHKLRPLLWKYNQTGRRLMLATPASAGTTVSHSVCSNYPPYAVRKLFGDGKTSLTGTVIRRAVR
jgi:hypothetical protein